MATNVLTKTTIDALKPMPTRQRVFDGEGMYLEVTPAGGKLWRLTYRFNGKEKLLSLGAYPTISFKVGRRVQDAATADCHKVRRDTLIGNLIFVVESNCCSGPMASGWAELRKESHSSGARQGFCVHIAH